MLERDWMPLLDSTGRSTGSASSRCGCATARTASRRAMSRTCWCGAPARRSCDVKSVERLARRAGSSVVGERAVARGVSGAAGGSGRSAGTDAVGARGIRVHGRRARCGCARADAGATGAHASPNDLSTPATALLEPSPQPVARTRRASTDPRPAPHRNPHAAPACLNTGDAGLIVLGTASTTPPRSSRML